MADRGQGEEHRLGPNLWNIVGRGIGSEPGFAYSKALANAGGKRTAQKLERFLENHKGLIKGTKIQSPASQTPKTGKALLPT